MANKKVSKDHSYRSLINELDRIKIIEFWKTNKNNTVSEIKKHFNYSKGAINNILDNHLKPKINGNKIRN